MKKTVNVNIGSVPFIIDEDAYFALDNYLGDIKSRIDESNPQEVLDDIESRVADILSESLSGRSQVVTMDMVRRVKSVIGDPSLFGDRKESQGRGNYSYSGSEKRLYRSRKDKYIAGICGGIAEYLNTDPTLVRIITILLIPAGLMSLWIYLILWIIIPKRPL